MSKAEVRATHLAVLTEPTARELDYMRALDSADTWVYFVHACGARKGQHDRVGYDSQYGDEGYCYGNCCHVSVAPEVWSRWQAMSEFERQVWSVREEAQHEPA